MSKFSSSSSKASSWIKLIAYSAATWLLLFEFLPWMFGCLPGFKHSREQQEKYDIHAGAMYYTDVPVSLESEMLNREAVQRALEKRKSSM